MDATRAISLMEGFPRPEREAWQQAVENRLKADIARLASSTDDDLPIAPLYTRSDQPSAPDFAGLPGFAPKLRGARADERRCRNMPRLDAPDPNQARTDALTALEGGADGLVVVIDDGRPEDQDAEGIVLPLAEGAIGEALETLLAEVRLDWAPVVLEAGLAGDRVADAFLQLCRRRGQHPAAGSNLGLDPLAMAARVGEKGREKLRSTLSWAQETVLEEAESPAVLRLSGRVWHDAGASEAQELAILCAGLVEALRTGEALGIAPEELARRTDLHLMADADFLLSIAKLRAARALVHRMAEAAGLTTGMRELTAETAPRMFTRYDPWTNILRATLAAQAALIGGAAAVTVRPHTDALGFADAHARRIARNIPLIMMEESALRQTMDAAGGSYALETLTRKLAEHAWRLFQRIERMGGLAAAVASGEIAEMIGEVARRRCDEIATRRRPITGVSEYPHLDEQLPAPPDGPSRSRLRAAAGVVGPAPDARWSFRPMRLAADFEAYRAFSDRLLAEHGNRPQIFLANIGPIARHTARATFAANAFAAGGIAPITNSGFPNADEMAAAFRTSGARIAVICGHDADYDTQAAAFATALKEAGATCVWLAGRPKPEQAEAWRRAGVNRFIGRGCNMLTEYDAALAALDLASPRGQAGKE